MKSIITLFVFILCAIIVQGQNSFEENYLKLQKPSKEDFFSKTFKGKELHKMIDSLELKNPGDKKNISLLKEAKEITVIIDIDNKRQASTTQIDKLLKSYEELTSMEVEQTKIEIRGITKKDKIEDLIILCKDSGEGLFNMIYGNSLFLINIHFKNPIDLENHVENINDISNLISINGSNKEGNSLIDFSFDTKGGWTLLPSMNELEIVKENNLFGVKMAMEKGKDFHFIIEPQYRNEIIIFRSDSYNSDGYIKVKSNDETYFSLYDQYGFIIAEADDIIPVFVPDSQKVIYFIVKKGNNYSLYECPDIYKQQQEKAGGSITAHLNYLLENYKSIKLKDKNTLECVTQDGTIELVTVKKRDRL